MSLRYDFHLFVCQNQRPEGHRFGCCFSKGSDKILRHLKTRVKELSLQNICITKSGCLGLCDKGPAVVVYPEGVWYSLKTVEDAEQVLQQHLIHCQKVVESEICKDL